MTDAEEYEFIRNIITDEHHEQRVALAKVLLYKSKYYEVDYKSTDHHIIRRMWDTEARKRESVVISMSALDADELKKERQKVRNRMNRLLNRICGFHKMMKGGK